MEWWMNEQVRVGSLQFDEPHAAVGEPGMFDYIKICLLHAQHSRPVVCTRNTVDIQARLVYCWCKFERATSSDASHMQPHECFRKRNHFCAEPERFGRRRRRDKCRWFLEGIWLTVSGLLRRWHSYSHANARCLGQAILGIIRPPGTPQTVTTASKCPMDAKIRNRRLPSSQWKACH